MKEATTSSVDVTHFETAGSAAEEKTAAENGRADEIKEVERRIRHKFDRRILPLGVLIYLSAQIDRSNIGNAVILGLSKDIGLVGREFNISLTLFYVTYILFEVLANMACHRFGPRIWLSFITFGFGAVTVGQAFIQNNAALLACRLLLGAFESGVQPGIVYAYSQFYRRREMGSRLGLKAVGASVAGAFGGLLASGLSDIPPAGILRKWRWIFLIEGLLTMLLGFVTYWFMPRDVTTASFLTDEERHVAAERIAQENMTTGPERLGRTTFKRAFFNVNTHLVGVALIASLLSLTSLSLFMPTLIKSMGYSGSKAQLLAVPPYVAAAVVCVVASFASDRFSVRGYILLGVNLLTVIGFAILATVHQFGIRYFALFIATSGAFTCSPILLAWVSTNSAGPAVRAVVSGYSVGIANVGSIIATWTYLPTEGPNYRKGHLINCGGACIFLFAVACNTVYLKWENHMRATHKRDNRLRDLSAAEIELLGHLHPDYRFIV